MFKEYIKEVAEFLTTQGKATLITRGAVQVAYPNVVRGSNTSTVQVPHEVYLCLGRCLRGFSCTYAAINIL